ncbi:MAG: autotransporter assembly complex protein TamA [Gammaproteobacteria bacterium]
MSAIPALAAVKVSVNVEGVKNPVKANVLATLGIAQYKNFGDHPAAAIRRLNSDAPAEIRHALQPFGYFSPKIHSTLTHDGDHWTATYRIEPGKPVILRHVTVKVVGPGADDPVFKALESNPPLRPGQPLNQQAYSQTKYQLQEVAADRGYLDADFTKHELKVDPKALWADATLVYATGPRYKFGQVSIKQNILDPAFMRRYVHIHPGDPYDAQKLANLQSALSASGYFSSVVVVPEKNKTNQLRVPIQVNTTPAKRNRYTFGLGYGTDTGPRLSFGWENRRINSKGHRFRFDTRLSQIQSQAIARYIVPQANPATDRLVYSATFDQQDYGDTVSHLLGGGIDRINQVGGWQQSVSLNANRYISDIGSQSMTSVLLMPGISFSRIVANPPDYPRHGYSINASFSGAAKTVASDDSFLRADISARFIFPLGPGRVLLHGEVGAIAASDFNDLPVALRFYAGGDSSVRGYAYQSIGPRNADGLVVGGKYLKIASVEYDFPIVGPWGLATFFDAGSASNSFTSSWNEGIGIGVRYRTPIGAVRLDFAHPIDHPELGFYRIHLSIGLAL